jgi:hypothetical protein
VDLKDIRLGLYRLQMEREVIAQKIAAALQSYEKAVYTESLEAIDRQMSALQTLRDANGAVYSPLSGCVVSCAETGSTVGDGEIFASIADTSGEKLISFTLDASAKYLSDQASVTVYYTVGGTEQTINLKLSAIKYRQRDNTYLCTAEVAEDLGLVQDQNVMVTVGTISSMFLYVIPASSVKPSDDGSVTFYVLRERNTWHGKAFCAYEVSSLVKEENDVYIALASSAMDPVVVSTDKPLSNGCEVILADS